IINALAQMPGLKVIARTSAFAFKGKNEDIRKIADTLGVTTVLEGSVRRAGSRIRVTAQLIQASDGTHLWSQRYDREMSDIFAVQDEISVAIAEALKVKLQPVPERRMPGIPAYEAYLRYRQYQWKFTHEAATRSKELLEEAVALDPGFALPYVGLADYHLALSTVGGIRSDVAMPRARELARRALEIDPDLPEAHAMLGIVAGHYDYDWQETERRFRMVTAREQMSPHLKQWCSNFWLIAVGRPEEAVKYATMAIEDDPLCQMWHCMRAAVYLGLGRAEQAIADLRRSVELDPQFWIGWVQLGLCYAVVGRLAEAQPCAATAYALAPWSPLSIGVMAGVFGRGGEQDRAQPLLDQLTADSYHADFGLGVYHLAAGDFERATESMLLAVDRRIPSTIPIVLRPYEPWLRQGSAWPQVLKKM